jgi:hypothetical protein
MENDRHFDEGLDIHACVLLKRKGRKLQQHTYERGWVMRKFKMTWDCQRYFVDMKMISMKMKNPASLPLETISRLNCQIIWSKLLCVDSDGIYKYVVTMEIYSGEKSLVKSHFMVEFFSSSSP